MLLFSARGVTDDTQDRDATYRALSAYGLEATVEPVEPPAICDVSAIRPVRLSVTVRNVSPIPFTGVVRIDLSVNGADPRFFLPGFMYGRNRGEAPLAVPHPYARIRPGKEAKPASSWWMVRGDRLANPCALIVADGRVRGLCASPCLTVDADGSLRGWEPSEREEGLEPGRFRFAGYTCTLGSDGETSSVGVTIGYENAPWLFVASNDVRDRAPLRDGAVELPPGSSATIIVDVFDHAADDERGIIPAMEHTYRRFHQPPRVVGDAATTVRDLSGAIMRDAWLDDRRMYAGFVFDRPSTFADRTGWDGRWYQELGSSSWTNGMAAAAPMLASALRLHDDAMRRQATACIDGIVSGSWNERAGLPFDAVNRGVWSNRGWWADGLPSAGHSSYLTGQAAYYVLESYRIERDLAGVAHDDWLDYVRRTVDTFERSRNGADEYPYLFDERTGAGIAYDSFAGAWCMAAGAAWTQLTGDLRHLDGLRRAERRYHDAYVRHMECYGAPLDTSKAVDSEGILAYVKAARLLHAITGDGLYLDHIRDALHYESTFRFCWNTPVSTPPLSHVGWSSCGGSVTSTCNPHIHPMSSNIIGDMAYYLDERDDAYLRSRMEDAVLWSCQTYNTRPGEYDYGDIGWMSERFCYGQGLLHERYPDGSPASTWFALMPWAAGSILDGLTGPYWDRYVEPAPEPVGGKDGSDAA